MEVELMHKSGNLLVRLKGELDHHSAEEIRKTIDQEWEKELARNIIFDLKDLKFMDSSGVGVIMGRYKQARQKGGKVAICGLSPSLVKIVELSGLGKLVYLYGELDEALNELAVS